MKDLNGFWVNKKSGTIHWVSESKAVSGGKKLWSQTTNLRYNRDYFFYEKKCNVIGFGNSLDNFLKNYEFICDSADVPHDFYVNVLANVGLKNDYSYGRKTNGRVGISKDEFFSKIKKGVK